MMPTENTGAVALRDCAEEWAKCLNTLEDVVKFMNYVRASPDGPVITLTVFELGKRVDVPRSRVVVEREPVVEERYVVPPNGRG